MPLSSDVQSFHCTGDVLVRTPSDQQPRLQCCHTSAQWAELKAVLISLANPPLDKTCYVVYPFDLPPERLQTGRLGIVNCGNKGWMLMGLSGPLTEMPIAKVYPLMRPTKIQLLIKPALPRLPSDMATHLPSGMGHKVNNSVSRAEATSTCQTWDSCPKVA